MVGTVQNNFIVHGGHSTVQYYSVRWARYKYNFIVYGETHNIMEQKHGILDNHLCIRCCNKKIAGMNLFSEFFVH